MTGARSDNASMTLERFGCQPGTCYLTIFNHSETRQQATVTLTTLAQPSTCRDLVRDTAVTWQDKHTEIELDAGDVCVLALEGVYRNVHAPVFGTRYSFYGPSPKSGRPTPFTGLARCGKIAVPSNSITTSSGNLGALEKVIL